MSRRLLLLLGLGILGVVLNHATVYGFRATFEWWWRAEPEVALAEGCDLTPPVRCTNYDAVGSPTYWGLTLVRRLISFGVPAFLLVSGYFIAFAAGKENPRVTWPILRSRLLTLIIPYLIWSTIIFGIQAVVYRQGIASPLEYVRRYLTGGASGSYYYIPMLVQMYLLSPLLVPLAKKHWRLTLLVTALVQFGIETNTYLMIFGRGGDLAQTISDLTPLWFFPKRFFWFALGAVLGFHYTKTFKPFLRKHVRWLIIGTVFFYVASLIEFELLLDLSGREWFNFHDNHSSSLYAIFFIFTFISLKRVKLPYQSWVTDLGIKSFGLYLIHEQMMEAAGRVIFFYAPILIKYQIVYQPILIVSAIAATLMLMALVDRTPLKKYAKYIFG